MPTTMRFALLTLALMAIAPEGLIMTNAELMEDMIVPEIVPTSTAGLTTQFNPQFVPAALFGETKDDATVPTHTMVQTDTDEKDQTVSSCDYPNDPLGYVTLYHSEVAYCDQDAGSQYPSYMDRDYSSNKYTQSFVPAAYIHSGNRKASIRGYVGVQPNVEAIIVSFRGSEDLSNWITNIGLIRTSYPHCSGCSVHNGFYTATMEVYSQVQDAVSTLVGKYPGYQIVVTGHSLGAALATLTALELIADHGSKVVIYNYGSPRMFNHNAADWASSAVRIGARRTHYKDIVPHSPSDVLTGFRHIAGEIYEGGTMSEYPNFPGGLLQCCDGEESKKCADQYNVGNIKDHLLYSGVHMGTGGCSAL